MSSSNKKHLYLIYNKFNFFFPFVFFGIFTFGVVFYAIVGNVIFEPVILFSAIVITISIIVGLRDTFKNEYHSYKKRIVELENSLKDENQIHIKFIIIVMITEIISCILLFFLFIFIPFISFLSRI
jgi:hypothetical protein